MEQIVDGAVPLLACLVNRLLELHSGLLFAHVQEECALHEADRGLTELIKTCNEHQHKQVDEDVCILPDLQEGLRCKLLKRLL